MKIDSEPVYFLRFSGLVTGSASADVKMYLGYIICDRLVAGVADEFNLRRWIIVIDAFVTYEEVVPLTHT